MNDETKQDLFWAMKCIEAISYNDDLTAEEEEAIYNLYGSVKNTIDDLVDTSGYDPEKLM